ncbi:signal peptide peptidase SppA [uncultured Cetobacterium sp.]|uniref:signal peptide peptidase SppA n=1 Tax=uncultured Cetobacterium sp. TaxID=527638 RepID=UPI00260F1502|nr:signal peptide peptidase SppA [uncultured Cetobacterium sp.]
MILLRWIFNFLKFIIREISSMIIKFVFLLILIVLAFNYFTKTKKSPITKKSYLKIDLSKEFNETLIQSPLNFSSKSINFYQLLNNISMAKDDSNVQGIILSLDESSLSRSQIDELGEVLNEFKTSTKPIYSYGAMIDNNSLLVSSYSTETIMPPAASTAVNVTGYNKDIPYFKGLTEKLGIDVTVIHVGDFKTYGENYTRSEMSEENRSDLKRILDKSYSFFLEDLSKNRSIEINSLNSTIISGELMGESSESLKKYNLISTLNYWENFKKEKNIENITSIEEYIPSFKSTISNNKIAIVYADGEINYTSSKNPTTSTITPDKFISALEKAEKDDNVKGIVIRVNSPGGSALASDIICNAIKNIEKPIYVSIGSVAASGGYYISTAAKKIFADKNSITGSIGVVSLIPNVKELTNKIGVNMNDISYGKYSDLYSLTAPMTPERQEKIYNSNLKVYKEFLNKVAYGRNLPLEEVEKIAQGKVWLGDEAIKIGLIDSIGGINTTIKSLATDLQINDNYSVTEISYEEDLKTMFESTIFPIQTFFSFKSLTKSENLKNLIENEDIFFKPILYLSF